MTLFQVLLGTGKPDIAVRHLREFERLTGTLTTLPADHESNQQDLERNRELLTRLTTEIDAAREELNLALMSGKPRLEVVDAAIQKGVPGEALRIIEVDQTVVVDNLNAQLLHSELLLDSGRLEEALTSLERYSDRIPQQIGPPSEWRHFTALANIAAGDYDRARELWADDARIATHIRLQSLLGMSPDPREVPGMSSIPLANVPRHALDARGLTRAAITADVLLSHLPRWSQTQFLRAITYLEQGHTDLAAALLQNILDFDPETELRPAVAFYLSTITGKPVEFLPPSQQIPVWDGMFAPDEAESDPASASPAETTGDASADAAASPSASAAAPLEP
jgi:tetratricopeptide (TPR) repeat protein